MLDCGSAAALQALLQRHGPELVPADVAAAWHVAVQQRLLTLARSGDVAEANLSALLVHLTETHGPAMDPTSLATTAWALAASSSGSATHISDILAAAEQTIVSFKPQELCVMLWAASSHAQLRDRSTQHSLFNALARLVGRGMEMVNFTAHDLSVLLWAMGMSSYGNEDLTKAVDAECAQKAADFEPGDAARAMHGFAMLRHVPGASLDPLFEHCCDRMEEFSPEEITLFMVSMGKLTIEGEPKFMKAAAKAIDKLTPVVAPPKKRAVKKEDAGNQPAADTVDPWRLLHPRHMAHILWTLAKLDHKPSKTGFITRMLRHLQTYPGLYAGEDVHAMLWACARLEIKPSDEVISAAVARMTALTPVEEASIIAGCLRYTSALVARWPDLLHSSRKGINAFAAVGLDALLPVLEGMEADDLAAMVVALGTLEVNVPVEAAARLQRACSASMGDMSSNMLPKLAWAAVRLHWLNAPFLDGVAAASVARVGLMTPQGLTQLAWAFAASSRTYPELVKKVMEQASAKMDKIEPKDKARLAWAFTNFGKNGQIAQPFLQRLLQSLTTANMKALDPVSIAAVIWVSGRLDKHPG